MGLAIDGNEVHGIARGGQAFVSIGNANTDGSINISGQDYFSKNNMKVKGTGEFNIVFGGDESGGFSATPVDVTGNLSNYEGYLAICVIYDSGDKLSTVSQPITIPTAPTNNGLLFQFDSSDWWGALSRTTDNRFTLTLHYINANSNTEDGVFGYFYVLTNN